MLRLEQSGVRKVGPGEQGKKDAKVIGFAF